MCSCGSSFTVAVVSDQFEGKKLLDRHKLVCMVVFMMDPSRIWGLGSWLVQVNAALKEELKDIHALSVKKCWTIGQQAAAQKA